MKSDNLEPVPDERWEMLDEIVRIARQEWAIEAFLIALGPSSAPAPRLRWTATEWNRLMFLKWQVERGLVAA